MNSPVPAGAKRADRRPAYTRALLDAVLRKDFGTFLHKAFHTISPGHDFLPNWSIDALIYMLMQIYKGVCRRWMSMR